VQHAPTALADAFCASRVAADFQHPYGALPRGTDTSAILGRAAAPA
jgi:putative acyl-CoA dehydrogenase